jgi:hypothetical protein
VDNKINSLTLAGIIQSAMALVTELLWTTLSWGIDFYRKSLDKFTLQKATKVQRGSRGKALLFL